MLPADVGAAPAAATRYQGTIQTPPAARRDRPASDADPFGDLVDQYADDAEPSAAGGHGAIRPASRQAATAQPQPQAQAPALVPDATVAGSTTPATKAQPRPDDESPAVVTAPAATDAGRTDLSVPQLLTPFELPLSVPASAGATGSDVAGAEGRTTAGTTLVPSTWHQPVGLATAPGTPFDAPQVAVPGLATSEAEPPPEPAGMALADLNLPEGMPLEAAGPEVLAALRAARATNPSGSPDAAAAVSAVASSRAVRVAQPPNPTAPSSPREVAMAAVREALTQPVDRNRPATTPSTADLPEPELLTQPAPVVADRVVAERVVAPVVADAPVPSPDAAPVAALVSPEPRAADPAGTVTVTAEQASTEATSIRAPRPVRHVAGQPQMAASNAPSNEAELAEDTLQGTPGRKVNPDDAPVPVARPTARAAQAIAAFQAAAAIGATSTPAAVNAAVAGAAVSSTALLDAELPTQLIHAIRVQFDQGSGEARIKLNPGFLGGVTVGVQIDGSSVTASLQAASADVREWMRTNESTLRQALADQGLQLDRLIIVDEDAPASDDGNDARPREEREQQAPRRQRRTSDQGTFELVF